MTKSVLSVVAGYAVMVLITMALFAALGGLVPDQFGMEPSVPPGGLSLVVILTVGLGAALSGGWVTGRLAPRTPGRHVDALVTLVLVLGLLNFIVEATSPTWYRIGLMIVGVAGTWLGGRLRLAQLRV